MGRRGHVDVAGAGLAGLTVATALARRGWSVRVNERACDDVAAVGEPVHSPELRDHRHRLLQREWLRDGRLYPIPRRDPHAALVKAARSAGVDIRTPGPGKQADLAILDRDPRRDADEVRRTKVDALYLAGQEVYRRDG